VGRSKALSILHLIDIAEVRSVFPHISNISPLNVSSGQKEICRGELAGAPIVLKLILPSPGAEERFKREIEAVRQLGCSYVPSILETGQRTLSGQTRQFVIEQFIDGDSYRQVLTRQPVQDFKVVLELTRVLLAAAADFEGVRIVHRDIKPDNLMVDRAGKIWVLDFGISRHLGLSSLTPTAGLGVGTIGYASPEQFRNMKDEIDGRADLFSIGLVAHESLYG
jgi:eukaryotic-like serine/threonine-protein kinase